MYLNLEGEVKSKRSQKVHSLYNSEVDNKNDLTKFRVCFWKKMKKRQNDTNNDHFFALISLTLI